MKRILAIVLIVVTGLCLTCCKETPSDNESNISEITDVNSQDELAHVHSYSSTVIEPTCTSSGYTKYTCECGDTYNTDEMPQLGHSYGAWTVTKEATETETGLQVRTCSRCGTKNEAVINKITSSTNKSQLTPGEKAYFESLGITEEELHEIVESSKNCIYCGQSINICHRYGININCYDCGELAEANTCHYCK